MLLEFAKHMSACSAGHLQVGVDALARAAAPEEEGGRGMTLDKNAKRRIVLASLSRLHVCQLVSTQRAGNAMCIISSHAVALVPAANYTWLL